MHLSLPPLLPLLAFLAAASAAASPSAAPAFAGVAAVTISVPSSAALPSPQALPPSTHALLTAAHRPPLLARLDRKNRCIFPAVPPGSYLLEVVSRDFGFEAVRVDVVDTPEEGKVKGKGKEKEEGKSAVTIEAWQTFRGHAWASKGERLGGGTGTLEIEARATGPKVFFEQRQGLNVVGLLSNPMILIGIAGLAMMVGMPKLLESMDPEMRKEFEEQQAKSPLAGGMAGGNPMGGLDLAGWMAGSNKGAADAGTSAGSGAEPGGGGKARKRG